jgi:hypothetical protein
MAIGDIIGSILGNNAGRSDMERALAASQQARDELRGLYVPTVEEQQILLNNPELAGLLEAQQLGESQLAGVSVDPRLQNAQMSALEELAGLSQQGLGVEDQAAFNNLRRQAGAESQAQQQSILANAEAQGLSDSGNTLMAQLNASQAQANRLQQGGEAQAAAASEARRNALFQQANLSSSMANQDFNQKSQVGSAKDSIDRFNAQNRQDVNQYNLGQRQNINNTIADNANRQEMYNQALKQHKYQNDLSKATGIAAQTNNLASQYSSQGQAAAQGQATMNSGLVNAGAGIAGAFIARPSAQTASDEEVS